MMRIFASISIVAVVSAGLGSFTFAQTPTDPTTEAQKKKKKKKTGNDGAVKEKQPTNPPPRATGLPPVQPTQKEVKPPPPPPPPVSTQVQNRPPVQNRQKPVRQNGFESTKKNPIVWANTVQKAYFIRECPPETDTFLPMKLKDVQKRRYQHLACPTEAAAPQPPLEIKD